MVPTVEWRHGAVVMIDQRRLPGEEAFVRCRSHGDVAAAIKDMVIRGAPAIGVAAALGVALGVRLSREEGPALEQRFAAICSGLAATRPTARPENVYLTVSEAPAWALLERLAQVPPAFAYYLFRSACGLEPCPQAARIVSWLEACPVKQPPFRTSGAPPLRLDLSIGSPEVGTLDQVRDQARLDRILLDRMREAGTTLGIGRYDEARVSYTDDRFRGEGNDGPVWRTVHIGRSLDPRRHAGDVDAEVAVERVDVRVRHTERALHARERHRP